MSLERWAADLIAILDALGIERATLIGQSLGGYIAQRVWLDAPARVEAMIIIGSTPITPPYPRYEVWALKQSVAMIRWWPFEHFAKTVGRSTALNPDARRYATDAILRMGKQRFMAVWDGVAGAISTRGVPETPPPPPTLLLQGQHDKAGTIARDMPRWAARWPHARLHIIEGAAHNANQDQPEEVNRLILDFLD
jgi:pimeloyl-ACP methyl ester carboxylesterase